MIPAFINRFIARKGELEARWTVAHPVNYKAIVEGAVSVLGGDAAPWKVKVPDPARIDQIGGEEGRGALVFVIGCQGDDLDTYWGVAVDYGSCSGCDTLQAIRGDIVPGVLPADPPTPEQTADYITLALHIVEGLKEL